MNYKKIISAALCLCLAAPLAFPDKAVNSIPVSAETEYSQSFYENLVYKNYGDHIEIFSVFSNAEGEIEVPSEILGVPVTVVGEHAFAGISKLTSVKLPDSVTSIGKQAFSMCSLLETVELPAGITEIGDETFLNCASLTNITLPENITSIGVRAFFGCTKLESINIPDTVTSLGAQAFDSCQSLASANVPQGLTVLEEGVFYGTALTELTVPYNVTKISSRALPSSLKTLTIINPDCSFDETYHMWNIKESECVIIAPQESAAQNFALRYGFESQLLPGLLCEPVLMGDCNNDGVFSIADLVTLRKWLLGTGELTAWQLADLTGDEVINVFDLSLMRKQLIEQMSYIAPPASLPSVVNLANDYQAEDVTGAEADEEFVLGQTEFALELLKKSLDKNGDNTLVSPYSVMQALAMTANGADGSTKTEMENVLGGLSVNKLNEYLYTQRTSQPDDEKCRLLTANSIWTRDDSEKISVFPDFLQTNVNYYDADVFKAPFDDDTLTAINNRVKENTDGMIPSILDQINSSAVMYLINAVAFDAEWETPYEEYSIVNNSFAQFGDEKLSQSVPTMCSTENYYLEDENAVGILKYYEGRKYAFAALLPNEGISVDEYISGLTADSLNSVLSNPQIVSVYSELPKFSYDFDIKLNDALAEMGMPTAFTPSADFTKMAETATGQLFIGLVKHKTHIEVNEAGTKAGAATLVEMNDTSEALPEKEIYFNRPFVYAIVDTETSLPVFIGTLTNIPEDNLVVYD